MAKAQKRNVRRKGVENNIEQDVAARRGQDGSWPWPLRQSPMEAVAAVTSTIIVSVAFYGSAAVAIGTTLYSIGRKMEMWNGLYE